MSAEPVLLALIFADRVITEDNGKKGIIGTFTNFQAPDFPFAFPPWAVYIAVTNLDGEHDFAVHLEHAETEQAVLSISGQLSSAAREDVIEMPVNIGGAVFPLPGKYMLHFQVGDQTVGSRALLVAHAPVHEN